MSRRGRTGEQPVDYETARSRVACAMANRPRQRWPQSALADAIWPGHTMTRQGAALAAGRFSRRLLEEQVIAHGIEGYVIGSAARIWSGVCPRVVPIPLGKCTQVVDSSNESNGVADGARTQSMRRQ